MPPHFYTWTFQIKYRERDMEENFFETHPRMRPLLYFIKFNRALIAIFGFAIFVIMCVNVVARYILKADLNDINEYLFFCMAWLFFMGSGVGAYEKSHLTADVFDTLVKNPKVIAVQTFIKNTLELLLYGAFFVCAINMVRRGIKIPMYTTTHHLPYLIGYASVCYCGFMMLVYDLVHYCIYIPQ